MKKCPRCGCKNPDDRKWCAACKKPLLDNPAAEQSHDVEVKEPHLRSSVAKNGNPRQNAENKAGDCKPGTVSGFPYSVGADSSEGEKASRLIGSMGEKRYRRKGKNAKPEYAGVEGTGGGFCTNCGNSLGKGDLFCTRCGKPVVASFGDPPKKGGDFPPKNRWRRPWLWVTLVCAVVLAGGLWGFFASGSDTLPIKYYGSHDSVRTYENGDVTFTPNEENIAFDKSSSTIYFNNLLIVYTFDTISENDAVRLASMVRGEAVGKLSGAMNILQIKVPESSLDELNTMAECLMTDENVLFASFDYPITFSTSANENPWSNDPNVPEADRGNEGNPAGNDWWAEAIGAYTAWEYADRCQPIKVGVIDDGFWDQHDDLSGKISFLPGYTANTPDVESHGTHVAGLIAASNNRIGIRGVADKASLICVDWNPTGDVSYLGSGEYLEIIKQMVENNVKVINNSWGFHVQSEKGYTKGWLPFIYYNLFHKTTYDEYVAATENYSVRTAQTDILKIIELLINGRKDFLIVQSAGNGYDNSGPGVDAKYTCHFCGIDERIYNSMMTEETREKLFQKKGISYHDVIDRVIIVGAVDNITNDSGNYQMRYSSNYGNAVSICAPGGEIFSTLKLQKGWPIKQDYYGYGMMSGTSMAAPIVSGSVAFLWSIDPAMSPGQVKDCLIRSAIHRAYDPETGTSYPMLNLGNAVQSLNLNDSNATSNPPRVTSDERDIVLVLDTSGSMDGNPLAETKNASVNFIETILQEDASIGIVTYNNSAALQSDFSMDETALIGEVYDLYAGGGTNIEAGLAQARSMLSTSNAKKKIIVLMSDGEPNDGKEGDALISYADEIKNDGIRIYTLGFFESLGSYRSTAQQLMEGIASDGCHYEVANANDLKFFFGDVADQINGQKFIYVRIACPVEAYVSYNGEVLSSSERRQNFRTSFGTITFEENENGTSDPVKILRLKEPAAYDVKIIGTGNGAMDYTIGFMDGDGEYTDLRFFSQIPITNQTVIDTVASASQDTVLNVDSDGDGKYDVKYRAEAGGYGKKVGQYTLLYIGICGSFAVVLCRVLIYGIRKRKACIRKRHKSLR